MEIEYGDDHEKEEVEEDDDISEKDACDKAIWKNWFRVPKRLIGHEAQLYVEFVHLKNPINNISEECKSTIGNLVKP